MCKQPRVKAQEGSFGAGEVARERRYEAHRDGPWRIWSFSRGAFWPTLHETFPPNDMKNH